MFASYMDNFGLRKQSSFILSENNGKHNLLNKAKQV